MTNNDPTSPKSAEGHKEGPLQVSNNPSNIQTEPSDTTPGHCHSCGHPQPSSPIDGDSSGYIYAVGRIEPRFPSPAVEKEFAQAVGRAETARLTDRQMLHAVLSQPENRYLGRQICWVLTIQGLDTYLLLPRDPADLDLLIDALRPDPSTDDQDVVIGAQGRIAPPEMCNGLMVPIVIYDQVYSFDRRSLLKSMPKPDTSKEKDFRIAANEVFDRIIQITGNTGSANQHRALNYLAIRYPAIYAATADAFARDASLSAVDVRWSSISSTRRIAEVIFSYTNRKTDVTEKFFVRVDVSEEFPFLITKLTPYVDR